MSTFHEFFIQEFYEDSPLEGMTGTRTHPCYYCGNLAIDGDEILEIQFTIPEDILMMLFDGKLVNLYIPEIGLLRKIKFQKTFKLTESPKSLNP